MCRQSADNRPLTRLTNRLHEKPAMIFTRLPVHFFRHFFWEKPAVALFAGFITAVFGGFRFEAFSRFTATFCLAGRRKEGEKEKGQNNSDVMLFHVCLSGQD